MRSVRHSLRVMTFNIRGASSEAKDGVNSWSNRAAVNVSAIKHYAPDLIGFQELQRANLRTYRAELPEYSYRLGPKYSNASPYNYPLIFWRSSRFGLVDSGTLQCWGPVRAGRYGHRRQTP